MGGHKNRIVGLEYVSVDELHVHPKNWRLHPPDQRSALSSLLDTIGIADAVLAYRSSQREGLTLIDGHLRRELMDGQVPVLVLDLDDEEADALLAAHDVITTMAVADEAELAALLDDITILSRDVLIAIDPDLEGAMHALVDEAVDTPKYEIVPQLDEGYDYVVIFAMRETEYSWLRTVLELPTKLDRKRVGLSHVLTVPEFRERYRKWQQPDHVEVLEGVPLPEPEQRPTAVA